MAGSRFLAQALEWAASPAIYPLVERLADARLPRPLRAPLYRTLARLGRLDLDEVEGRLEDFASLSEFFVRPLVPGARPGDPDPAAWLSPADGVLQGVGSFGPGEDPVVPIKGSSVALARTLGPYAPAIAGGGHYFVVYLSPRNYHRVHSPVAGRILSWQAVGGTRYPVNRLGFRARPDVLSSNERTIVEVEPAGGGRLFLVLVAAWGVARTRLAFAGENEVRRHTGGPPVALEPPRPLARGGEVGSFNLGSTVVAIWPAPRDPVRWLRCAGPVRVGQGVVRGTASGAG
jgi:phosphatidylserine decarboxylase